MAALYCPFCSAESSSGFAGCTSCGVAYSPETLSYMKVTPKARKRFPDDHRKQICAKKMIKVAYAGPKAFVDSYLFNHSLGGVFIETDDPGNQGEKVELRVFLPDKGEAMEVSGEVTWNRKEAEETPEGKMPPGMGVKFLDLSKGNVQRIIAVLNRTLP